MDIETKIIKLELYEILPLVNSLYLKRRYMLLSFDSITHAEEKLIEKMHAIKAEKEAELSETGHTAWGIKDRERWNVNIEGFEVDILDFVGKDVCDFFHYARICLEMMIQIILALAYDPSVREQKERENISAVIQGLPKEYNQIKTLLGEFKNSEQYQYILAADNYIKHIDSLNIKLKTKNILDDFDSFVLNDFIYQDKQYESRIVSEITKESKDFVIESICKFFNVLFDNGNSYIERKNIITKIKYESLSKGANTVYLSFFIDVDEATFNADALFGGNNIFVRPIRVDKNYNIYEDKEFMFDTIFIRQCNTKTIIGKAIFIKSTRFYKQYKVEQCSESDYIKYISEFKGKYQRIRINNMLAYSGIEKRVLNE